MKEQLNKEDLVSVIGLSGESIFLKIDNLANLKETVAATNLHIEYGGKGFNQAVAIRRCGINCAYLSCFGDDDIKSKSVEVLNKENIEVLDITKKSMKSALATIITDLNGKNCVTCYQGVSTSLNATDVELFEDYIKRSKYLLLQLECSDESLFKAIKLANKYSTKIILNPAPAHKLPLDILKQCYLLTPNEYEAKLLFNIEEVNEETLKNLPFKNIIITLGSKGCLVKQDDKIEFIEAIKTKAIDSTGAGDTFNGVLAACLTKSFDLVTSAKYAVVASGLSVQKEYVINSIPFWQEIERNYKKV